MAKRKPSLIGGRYPGHRYDHQDPYNAIYYGARGAFAQLGDACWWPDHGEPRNPGLLWRVHTEVCGARVHLDAVIDDFGDLQVVQAAPWCVATVPDQAER